VTVFSTLARAVAPAFVCFMAVAACGKSGGSSGGATGGGGSGGAGVTYAASPCGTCVTTACASEIDACSGDPGCAAYLGCLDACPVASGGDADVACASACGTGSSTESTMAISQVNACRSKGPGAACPACGLSSAVTYTAPALNQMCPSMAMDTNACFICDDEHCCQTYATCHDDAECHAFQTCIQACPSTGSAPCFKACTEQHPAGADTFGPYDACGTVLCGMACAPTTLTACEECTWGTCGDTYAYFLSTTGGVALLACVQTCAIDDTACDSTCYGAFPAAYQKYSDYAACVAVACKDKGC
jgi:hypothetical protein